MMDAQFLVLSAAAGVGIVAYGLAKRSGVADRPVSDHLQKKTCQRLATLLREVRHWIEASTDFSSTGWRDLSHALAVFDRAQPGAQRGGSQRLADLFANGGKLQKLAAQNGWSGEFESLAIRYQRLQH